MTGSEVLVHGDAAGLAASAAGRLVTLLVDRQAAAGSASVVLTGGGLGIAVLEHLRVTPARDALDWSRLDVYWGDERFLADGDPERNETQARAALLDHVRVDPERVHPMAASDRAGTADAAADAYADLLDRQARPEDHGPVPQFDVCLLGMGIEGHVASVFPHSPAVYDTERTVVGVHGCPKPPPVRVSLTLPTIRNATEVWLLVSGKPKAAAVSMALGGAGEVALPAAGATGARRTRWLLDRAAASRLPRDLFSPLV